MLFITCTWQPHRTNSCCSVRVTKIKWLMAAHLLHSAYFTLNSHFSFSWGTLWKPHVFSDSTVYEWMNVLLYQKLKSLKNHDHRININTSPDVFTSVGFLPTCMHGLLYNRVTVKYCSALLHIVQVFHFFPSISKNELPCCWARQNSCNLSYTAQFAYFYVTRLRIAVTGRSTWARKQSSPFTWF